MRGPCSGARAVLGTALRIRSACGLANAGPSTLPGPEGSNSRGDQRVAGPFHLGARGARLRRAGIAHRVSCRRALALTRVPLALPCGRFAAGCRSKSAHRSNSAHRSDSAQRSDSAHRSNSAQRSGGPLRLCHSQSPLLSVVNGEGGIRTRGTVSSTHDFQSCTFDHSVTSPGQRAHSLARRQETYST